MTDRTEVATFRVFKSRGRAYVTCDQIPDFYASGADPEKAISQVAGVYHLLDLPAPPALHTS